MMYILDEFKNSMWELQERLPSRSYSESYLRHKAELIKLALKNEMPSHPQTISESVHQYLNAKAREITGNCVNAQILHDLIWKTEIQCAHHSVEQFKQDVKKVEADIKNECEFLKSQGAYVVDVKINSTIQYPSPDRVYEGVDVKVRITYWMPEEKK